MADLTGNGYKDLILLARSVQHQYAMEEFSTKQLRPILRALNKATAEIMRDINRRNDTTTRVWSKRVEDRNLKILRELENMTLGIRDQLKEDISDVYVKAADKSLAEHNSILSFDGAVADSAIGFNSVSLSKEQLMAIAVDVPVGGKLLSEWVDVAFTSQIQDRIREEVLTGVLKGEGTAKLVRRISQGFDGTKREITSLVRTMVAEANNSAAEKVYEANSDIIKAQEWSATLEVSLKGTGKTCPRCIALDGQEWPLGEYHPPIPLHIRCVTAESIIFALDATHFMKSKYSGPIVKLTFASGATLSVTSNHMLMGPDGLVMARFLTNGDYLFGSSDFKRSLFGDPNDDRNDFRIDNVIKSFSETAGMVTRSVPVSSENFHGDGEFGQKNIDVIDAQRFLVDGVNTKVVEHFTRNEFIGEDLARLFNGQRSFSLLFQRHCSSTHRLVGLSREFFSFVKWCLAHPQDHGFAFTPGFDTIVFEKPMYRGSGNAIFFGECLSGHSVIEETDEFVRVDLAVAATLISLNRKSIPNKHLFGGITFNAKYSSDIDKRHSRLVKGVHFTNINFGVFDELIRNSLLAQRPYGYAVGCKNPLDRAVGNPNRVSNIGNGIPRLVKGNNIGLATFSPPADNGLFRTGSHFNTAGGKCSRDSGRAHSKLGSDIANRRSTFIGAYDFMSERLNPFNGPDPEIKPIVGERVQKPLLANLGALGDIGNANSGGIDLVQITNVEVIQVENLPVYDVSTLSTSYIVNGIVSSNCRCFMVPKTISYKELGLNIPDLKKSARPYTIRNGIPIGTGRNKSILEVGNFTGDASKLVANLGDDYMLSTYGRGRYDRIKAGKVKVKDLVDKDGNLIPIKDLPKLDGKASPKKPPKSQPKAPAKKPKPAPPKEKQMPSTKDVDLVVKKHYDSVKWTAYDKKIEAASKAEKIALKERDDYYNNVLVKSPENTEHHAKAISLERKYKSATLKRKAETSRQRAELDSAVLKAVAPPSGGTARVVLAKTPSGAIKKGSMDAVKKGKPEIEKMFHPSVLAKVPPIKIDYRGNKRAYYQNGSKTIMLGNQKTDVLVHEYAHAVEHNVPGFQDAANAFLKRRTEGESLKPIFKGSKEVGWEDDFFSHYCGKYYKTGSTEIISMGVQKMYTSPHEFFEKDPEYFDFIVKTMWGKHD